MGGIFSSYQSLLVKHKCEIRDTDKCRIPLSIYEIRERICSAVN